MMLVSLTNQLGYNLSFPLSPLPTTFRLICGLEKSWGTRQERLPFGDKRMFAVPTERTMEAIGRYGDAPCKGTEN